MRTLVVASLFAASLAWGATCTTVAPGDWSAQTTWGSVGTGCVGAAAGGIPGNNDIAVITTNVTVYTDTTIGNSPADVITSAPTAVVRIERSNGTTSDGKLIIASGVTFTVRGSVSFKGGSGTFTGAWLTLNAGSTWIFDNSAAPSNGTGVYRLYSVSGSNVHSQITTNGTDWTTSGRVTIYGRLPSCPQGNGTGGTCKNAIWTAEVPGAVTGSSLNAFRNNVNFTRFWYFGGFDDSYRSMYLQCQEADTSTGNFWYWQNVEFHFSSGFSVTQNFPCAYTDFKIINFKTFDSTTSSTSGFWTLTPGGNVPDASHDRTAQYIYLDRGMSSGGGNVNFGRFKKASYIVLDGQCSGFGPSASSALPAVTVDHMLIKETCGSTGNFFFGDTSYMLFVADGGMGGGHMLYVPCATHNFIVDHLIFQPGDSTIGASGGAAHLPGNCNTAAPAGTVNFNHWLVLPLAADQRWTSYTTNLGAPTSTNYLHYNHMVYAFGADIRNVPIVSPIGSAYYGESWCGPTGTGRPVWLKNSILWNPNPSAGASPVYAWTGSGCPVGSIKIAYDYANLNHNVVYRASTTPSQRWTFNNGVTVCGTTAGDQCGSYGTPYDVPTEKGNVPGLDDLPYTTAPQFVWQQPGPGYSAVAPGPREWANIRFGVPLDDTTGTDVAGTQVHFGNVFRFVRDGDMTDLTTTAGFKGRIDDLFQWHYAEWASTNPALKGAADDVPSGWSTGDIGAAPVTILCPSAYPVADISRCNSLAQAGPPTDLGSSPYSAGSN